MKKFQLPEQSKPTEELIDRLSVMDTEKLVEEILKYKELREKNNIAIKNVCFRSRLHPTWLYRLEGLSMIPTVKSTSMYVQAVTDCITDKGNESKQS